MKRTMRPAVIRAVSAMLAVAASAAGCRDGVPPYTTEPPEVLEGDIYRLTFSRDRDFNPTWSRNSDTVFYSTEHFFDQPQLKSTLIRIARTGGTATLLAPNAVSDTFPRLVLPVPSPGGNLVAYIHIPFIRVAALCVKQEFVKCENNQPLLEAGMLRVRDPGSTRTVGLDQGVPVTFAGRNPPTDVGGLPAFNQQFFPFQQAFVERGEFLFRPSWEPTGQRIVFSDGLSLRLWDLAQSTTTVIPGTSDGVSAAWSPTGNVIAFTRLMRNDSTRVSCRCQDPPDGASDPIPEHVRWAYTVSSKVIALVDPAGTATTDLVMGEDPAWSPDGAFLYFVADDRINRIPATGGTVVPIPGTVEGRSPSVSPDGQWLAFTRPSDDGRNSDIWVSRITPP